MILLIIIIYIIDLNRFELIQTYLNQFESVQIYLNQICGLGIRFIFGSIEFIQIYLNL